MQKEIIEFSFDHFINQRWLWYPGLEYVLWLMDPLKKTVELYKKNNSINLFETPYCKTYTNLGSLPHTDELKRALMLWEDVEKNGFKPDKGIITISFKDDGRIQVYDGFHRIIMLKSLGYKGKILANVIEREEGYLEFKNKLEQEPIYHPINHPEFYKKGYRIDSIDRFNIIKNNMDKVHSIVDLGCCEGYFSLNFANLGKNVIGIDYEERRIFLARYLNNLYFPYGKIRAKFKTMDIKEFVDSIDDRIDAGIFLSTFHHFIVKYGEEGAWKLFNGLSEKINVLFFSMATDGDSVTGWSEYIKNISSDEISKKVCDNFGYKNYKKILKTKKGSRDLFKFW